MREIGGRHMMPCAREVLAPGEQPVPDRLGDGVDGGPQQRQVAHGPEITDHDRAAEAAQDGARAQLGGACVAREPAPHAEPGPGARRALETLGRGHRDVGGEAHPTLAVTRRLDR